MVKSNFDVYGLGQCAWDHIGQIEKYPLPDSKCEISDLITQGGGPVATALVAISRWGFSCSFCGIIGDDYTGQQIIRSLEDEDVNTDHIIIREGFQSQQAFIAAEKNGGRRTIFWRRPTGQAAQPEEINMAMISTSLIFYTDGLFADASIAGARAAKQAGRIVVADAGTLRDGMLELSKYCDYFIVSESFAKALVSGDDPYKACERLRKLGPKVVGVTLGERGYLVQHQNNWIERPAYQVNAIDTTGCGDLFHAGIALGILKKWDLEKSLDFAAWAAASVSTRLGGRAGIPSLDAYQTRLNKSP